MPNPKAGAEYEDQIDRGLLHVRKDLKRFRVDYQRPVQLKLVLIYFKSSKSTFFFKFCFQAFTNELNLITFQLTQV